MITEEQKIRINELKEKGFSLNKIATELGLSWDTIRKHIINCVPKEETQNDIINSGDDTDFIAAKCFELFEEGSTPAEVVIQLKLSPDLVQIFYDKWINMTVLYKDEGEKPVINKYRLSSTNCQDCGKTMQGILVQCRNCGKQMLWF